jgi:hypothetical protein
MGILNFLKRARPSLPQIEHPVLGSIEATLANDDGSYFWETPSPLPTGKGPISVFFDGGIEGPAEEQVALWEWIYENSERFTKFAEPLLLNRLREFGLETYIGNLVWSAAGLSPDGDRRGPWDMSFTLSVNGNRYDGAILTAYFANEAPTGVVNFDD